MNEPNARILNWREMGKFQSKLVAGNEVVGTLSWAKGFGAPATGESDEGRWTFKRLGRVTQKIEVRTPGSGFNSAILTMGWRGSGVVDLSTGQTFRFAPKGFWRSAWVLTDSDQRRLMTMKPNFAWGKAEGSVEVEPAALSIRELPLLAMLCWYAVLLTSYDNSDGDGAIMASLVATGAI